MGTNSYAHPPFDPTRYPAGVTNANTGENLGNMGQLDPSKFLTFWEDFYVLPEGWDGVPTLGPGEGGVATMATASTVATLQPCVVLSPQRRFFFKARAALTAANGAASVGVSSNLDTPVDGVVATLFPGSVRLDVYQSGGSVISTIHPFAAAVPFNQQVSFGMEYDPNKNRFTLYLNDNVVGHITDAVFPVTTPLKFGIDAEGGSDIVVDYIFGAFERAVDPPIA